MQEHVLNLIKLDKSSEKYLQDITEKEFFGFPIDPIIQAEKKLLSKDSTSIAYFSMEFGLAPSVYHTFKSKNLTSKANILSNHEIFSNMMQMDYYHSLPIEKMIDLPIYSGGLGVLAGDSLKSSADLGISLAGIGILWTKGYFRQKFWFRGGGQFPEEMSWDPNSYPGLIPTSKKICITLNKQNLCLKLWKYYVYSYDLKNVIPLILLDSDLEENIPAFRVLTDQLYRSSDNWIKIAQRAILGIGGIKAIEALGYSINKYHLNEGHAAFAFVEMAKNNPYHELKKKFAYTCHTPVDAGHDRFNMSEIESSLDKDSVKTIKEIGTDLNNSHVANLTILAMNGSEHVNGVSKKHGEVTRMQFPQYADKIKSVTNGVHTYTWLSDPIKTVLLKHKNEIGNFEDDPTLLKNVENLKDNTAFREDIWIAHMANKKILSKYLESWFFNEHTFTICWARRIASYKRPTMLLHDMNRLINISRNSGEIQIIIAGKAHPADISASMHMDEMLEKIGLLSGERKNLRIVFLENYDTYFAKLLTSSVDVWLNNPLPPFEASGTSGMKAIVNGVLQLSTLDGWIVEAKDANIGSIFGYVPKEGEIGSEGDLKLKEDSDALYNELEKMMPMYYDTLTGKIKMKDSPWIDKMINCIAQSGYFSTHRMVKEYNDLIWNQ